jgi:phosphatidylglycerol:prolipoprotein diacylglycerol transferase
MNPIAFSVFGLGIRWYGILISLGMLVGILIARYSCKLKDINFDKLIDILIVVIPAAIIGARLYYVLFEFSYYKNNLLEIFDIRSGGLAIHGGVILGFLTAYLYTRIKKIDFIKYADAAAPSLILAQAIGRWGNFFNQEAHGGAVSYNFIKRFPEFIQRGMYIDGSYYHPTFLYESIWNIFVFLILMVLLKRSRKSGYVIFTYIGLYSIGRFLVEGLRTDSLMIGPFRIAQLVSLAGVTLWVAFIIITKYRSRITFKP